MTDTEPDGVPELLETIDGDAFRAWRREREFAENIHNGTPYFNGPPDVPPPSRHSPSQLLQCHRKAYYRAANAPKESADPDGIYWFGTQFETELAVPFLRDMLGPDQFVRNSLWIDETVTTDGDDVRLRGETDPVIVDRDNTPLLLTEIKTTTNTDSLTEPKPHHRAQVHAYLYGLPQRDDANPPVKDALVLYADRKQFTLKAFHVHFDDAFWETTVLPWAATNTTYRRDEILPPADPYADWECSVCDYRNRCGQTSNPHDDEPPEGLLPRTPDYPRQQLETYLNAHPQAKLTPTLAHHHPDLASEYGVYDWHCPACTATYHWDTIDWTPSNQGAPFCPDCSGRPPGELAGPQTDTQLPAEGDPQ